MREAERQMPLMLCLDDDWAPARREIYLAGFEKDLQRWAQPQGLEVALAATLAQGAARLEKAYRDRQPVALLVLDVMLNTEPARDLIAFGSRDKLLRSDAGLQLVSLFQQATTPDWVTHCRTASLLLLTSNAAVAGVIREYSSERPPALGLLDKAKCETGGKELEQALELAFLHWRKRHAAEV